MNSNHLSPRLEEVKNLVPKGTKIADIGSDHAYLIINLIKNGICYAGVAGEVAKGPLSNTKTEITENNLDDKIDARLGDGLAVLDSNDEIDVICIAGMGGQLIRRILEDGQEKLKNVKKLILQPNVGAPEVRSWLEQHGFKIDNEKIVAEDYHVYEMMSAVPGKMELSETELKFGPFLLNERNETFTNKWERELNRLTTIKDNLSHNTVNNADKLNDVEKEITVIEEMLGNEGENSNR